jgi:hypothetical protein
MSAERSKYKILYCYPYNPSLAYPDMKKWIGEYVSLLNEKGFDIEPFCITLDPPNSALSYYWLNQHWETANPKLINMYDSLEKKLEEGFDVLVNAVGINLHPEFVKKLPVFTVFCCADDPENSNNLSKPAAFAYDLSLVSNVAEVETYKSWGVKHAEWLPIGLWPHFYDPDLSEEKMIESLSKRDVDLFMMGDKKSPFRIDRMNKLGGAFPNGHFYGNGWDRGILPLGQEVGYMMRAKIGPNVHNSTGPINLRMYTLPANGVMQICDNKKHLGKVFELGKEVVGFDTIEEGIDLCRYYLAHDNERIEIALNGWRRVMRDYTEEQIFLRIIKAVDALYDQKKKDIQARRTQNGNIALSHKRTIFWSTLLRRIARKIRTEIKNLVKA